jgi:hypothetical protein
MPTATTTAADDLRRVIKEVGADPASNQERPSAGPPLGVHFTALLRRQRIIMVCRLGWKG